MKKRNKKIEQDIKTEKTYTIEELIELGKKNNYINLAKPLFEEDKKEDTKIKGQGN